MEDILLVRMFFIRFTIFNFKSIISIILGNITDIVTSKIVPVDLNSILQVNALTLSKWFGMMGDSRKAIKYRAISLMLLKNIQEV